MAGPPSGKAPSRRDLLKGASLAGVAAASGAATIAGAAETPHTHDVHPAAASAAPPRREALEALSASEAEVLEAVCARLIPTDANGPGAREARAAHYIDRALAGAFAASRDDYRTGLTGLNARAQKAKGKAFAALADAEQDALLIETEHAEPVFFALVRAHTIQGTFSDPYYGGNAGFVGWDLLSYPGIRLGVSEQQQALDPHLTKARQSAYDFTMFDHKTVQATLGHPAPVDHDHLAVGMGDMQHDN